MFDIGFWEITVITVIALIILGPERLPRAARTLGLWVGKARRTLTEVKRDIDRELDASELKRLSEVKDDIQSGIADAKNIVDDSAVKGELDETKKVFQDAASALNENVSGTSQTVAVKPNFSSQPLTAGEQAKATDDTSESEDQQPQISEAKHG